MPKNTLKLQEKEFFNQLYKGKQVLIKLSGAEIADENFEQAVKDIKALIADQIKIILVFGGGQQIDEAWEKNGHTEARPKQNGMGVTTPEVLSDAVLPAYFEIEQKLQKYFAHIEKVVFYKTNQLVAEIKDAEKFGLTGTPETINLQNEAKLQVIGFVGEAENGEKLNINADEIVANLVEKYQEEILEVIFVTKTGGIQNTAGKIVSTLSDKKIETVLAGEAEEIEVDGGMRKKLIETKKVLQYVNKVVITGLTGIYPEITKLSGSGTLLFPLEKTEVKALKNNVVFDLQYQEKVESGCWLPRTENEKMELKKNHFILCLNGSPLGGFSLLEKELSLEREIISGLLFACWWSDVENNGVGMYVLEKAIEKAHFQGKKMFFYTKQNLDKYAESLSLKHYEKIKSASGATLWITV